VNVPHADAPRIWERICASSSHTHPPNRPRPPSLHAPVNEPAVSLDTSPSSTKSFSTSWSLGALAASFSGLKHWSFGSFITHLWCCYIMTTSTAGWISANGHRVNGDDERATQNAASTRNCGAEASADRGAALFHGAWIIGLRRNPRVCK